MSSTIVLLNAVAALIWLAHTRQRVRLHPHHEHGPDQVASWRAGAISALADAAALAPLARDEMRQWATWIEAGAEDRNEDLGLARLLMRGLDAATHAKFEEAIAATPRCHGQCKCLVAGCGHTCVQHDLGGGRCTVDGCRCRSHVMHTPLPLLFHEAHERAVAALPVNGDDAPRESGEHARASRVTQLPADAGGA